jgi:hypothetical protein
MHFQWQQKLICKKPAKNACQAPKPAKPLIISNIQLAFKLGPIRYTGYRDQERVSRVSPGELPGLTLLDGIFCGQPMYYEYFADSDPL